MKADDLNPFLDDLFDEARTEAPVHSYASTRKALLAGLAIGGAGLIGAKLIASSILKTKFFIMSISTVAIITSAALVYTAGLKPTESMSEAAVPTPTTYAVVAPEPNELPDNLFIAAEVEPEDTVIVVEKDSIENVEEIVREIIESIDIENIEGTIEDMLETISEVDIDVHSEDFMESMEDLAESFEEFEIDFDQEEWLEIKQLLSDMSADSAQLSEIRHMIKEIELVSSELAESASQISSGNSRVMVVQRANRSSGNSGLTRRVFTITNETTDLDLEEFNKQATAAGMDLNYSCKVWSSKIRSLNMKLTLENDDSKQTTHINIRKVKRNESFAHNIIWYENAEGEAVKFNTSEECSSGSSHNHSGNQYYNHSDCDND